MLITDKWINSPKQLLPILQAYVDPAIKNTKKDTLESYADDEFIKQLLEFRNTLKLANTFIKPCKERYIDYGNYAVVHTSFSSFMTNTTRFSSSGPNAQNFPRKKEIRNLIQVKPPYCILTGDMSQIEPRILAQDTQDQILLDFFNSGKKFYIELGSLVLGYKIKKEDENGKSTFEYNLAKTIILGILYGLGTYGMAQKLKVSKHECQYYIDTVYDMFPSIRDWKEGIISVLYDYGYAKTRGGTKRYFQGIYGDEGQQAAAIREAVNMRIQGTAAECNRVALLTFVRAMRQTTYFYKLFSTVHDEANVLCFENDVQEIKAIMEKSFIEAHKILLPDVAIEMEIAHSTKWGDNK